MHYIKEWVQQALLDRNTFSYILTIRFSTGCWYVFKRGIIDLKSPLVRYIQHRIKLDNSTRNLSYFAQSLLLPPGEAFGFSALNKSGGIHRPTLLGTPRDTISKKSAIGSTLPHKGPPPYKQWKIKITLLKHTWKCLLNRAYLKC